MSRRTSFISLALLGVAVLAGPVSAVGSGKASVKSTPDLTIAFFGGNDDLYVMGVDGSKPKRIVAGLVRPPSFDGIGAAFAWSPDGSRIAFVEDLDDLTPPYRHFPGSIYVVQGDGGRPWLVVRRKAVNARAVTWSADGRLLGYARSTQTCNFCSETPFEAIAVNVLSGHERRVVPTLWSSATPVSGPSGGWIALMGVARGSSPVSLFVTRQGRTRFQEVSDVPGAVDSVSALSWSPDGQMIAFVARGWVRSIHRTGTNERRLARGIQYRGSPPSWSPDGRRIVFVRNTEIWVMDADGTHERRLTSGRASDSEPAWSPDGSRIAFTRHTTHGENSSIYVIAPDASGLHRLTRGPYDGTPKWRPS